MITQEIRDKAADWLQMVIDRVGEITEGGNPRKFSMDTYVVNWDSEHSCGTCCCVEGWLPRIHPDEITWNHTYPHAPAMKGSGKIFYPKEIGIPISGDLWSNLTVYGFDWGHYLIGDYARYLGLGYSEIRKIWEEAIRLIRSGGLDSSLLDSQHLQTKT